MSETVIGDARVTTSCSCMATYKWVVNNFWIYCFEAGDMLISPQFITSNDTSPITWIQLMFYPKGKTEEFKDYFSLFAKTISRSNNAPVKGLSLSISNEENELIKRIFDQPTQDDPLIWGSETFVNRNLIKTKVKNNKSRSDNLVICFQIKAVSNQDLMKTLHMSKPIKIVTKDYENIVDSTSLCDIELLIDGKSLNAHKLVLSQRSPVFAEMIKKQIQEEGQNNVVINIPPIHKYEIFLKMLQYIYWEQVDNIDDYAAELLIVDKEYKINGLKRVCEMRLITNVNIDNVLEKLKLAYSCDAELLKATTVGFISAHYDEISRKPEFKALAPEIAHDIFTAHSNRIM